MTSESRLPQRRQSSLALIYACSGCSNVAQLANDVALGLDHAGRAQMSCIAGVGGRVESLVKLARSGRTIVAIDGCPLACARACLSQIGVDPTHHVQLHQLGLKKRTGCRAPPEDVERVSVFVQALLEE